MRSRRQQRPAGDDDDVQADGERRVRARARDRVGGGGFGDHQAGGGDDPLAVAALDRLVDRARRVRSRRP